MKICFHVVNIDVVDDGKNDEVLFLAMMVAWILIEDGGIDRFDDDNGLLAC